MHSQGTHHESFDQNVITITLRRPDGPVYFCMLVILSTV